MTWTPPGNIADGNYEIASLYFCNFTNPTTRRQIKRTVYSNIVSGLIDRTPPVNFVSDILPASNVYYPGNEISVTFNEALNCNRPYVFSASLSIAASHTIVLNMSNLTVVCEDRTIQFEISPSAIIPAVCPCFE